MIYFYTLFLLYKLKPLGKKIFLPLALLSLTLTSILGLERSVKAEENMPNEYRLIKKVVNKLAKSNDLGKRPIFFTINSGYATEWAAQDLNLCKKGECAYFGDLNPFKSYSGNSSAEVNEAIRQAYIFGTTAFFAYSNGTISIARYSFKSLDNREDLLSCTIAHELQHFLSDSIFNDSLKASQLPSNLSKEKREIAEARFSRQTEVEADQGSVIMNNNAGYPLDTCLKALDYRSRIRGIADATSELDTHPGYKERLAKMRSFIAKYKTQLPSQTQNKTTPGEWNYDSDLNLLKFSPK